MKVPEPLFVVINPVVKALLQSPLHRVMSDSVMLIRFRGRKSGNSFSTPVRYLRDGDTLRAFSNSETQWWRNLRHEGSARILAAGHEQDYTTNVIENDPDSIRRHLLIYLAQYPEDAVYHDVSLGSDGTPDAKELDIAARHAIVVEARPVQIVH